MSSQRRYWFRPKRYGCGAYPSTWEGWALITVVTIAVFMSALLIKAGPKEFVVLALLLVLVLMFVSYHKTDGEWKWRWGGEDGQKKKAVAAKRKGRRKKGRR